MRLSLVARAASVACLLSLCLSTAHADGDSETPPPPPEAVPIGWGTSALDPGHGAPDCFAALSAPHGRAHAGVPPGPFAVPIGWGTSLQSQPGGAPSGVSSMAPVPEPPSVLLLLGGLAAAGLRRLSRRRADAG